MKILRALAGLVIGYIAGVALAFALVILFSQNTHDKSVEAIMTALFYVGPLGAIVGGIWAVAMGRGR